MVSAVLDRIEEGTAVLLLDGSGRLNCPVDVLPAGCRPGMWLLVQLEDGKVVGAELDPHKTVETGARIRSKMDELRRRGRVLP